MKRTNEISIDAKDLILDCEQKSGIASINDVSDWLDTLKNLGATHIKAFICDREVTIYGVKEWEETDEEYRIRMIASDLFEKSKVAQKEQEERHLYEELKKKFEL